MLSPAHINTLLKLSHYELSSFSFASGNAGHFVTFLEAFSLSQKKIFVSMALKELEQMLQREKALSRPLPLLFGASAGVLWALYQARKIIPEEIPSSHHTYYLELAEAVSREAKLYLSLPGRYELLSGALGIAVLGREIGHSALRELGENYLKQCAENNDWRSPEKTEYIVTPDFNFSDKINTGIAHGIAGVLLYGAHLVSSGENAELGNLLVLSTKNILFEIENTKTTHSIPSYAPDIHEPRQQGWCYGDPGIGYALLMAGEKVGEKIFKRGEEYFASQERFTFLCHGSAAIEIMKKNLGMNVKSFIHDPDSGPGLLSGTAGSILTEFLFQAPSVTRWENLLLLGTR